MCTAYVRGHSRASRSDRQRARHGHGPRRTQLRPSRVRTASRGTGSGTSVRAIDIIHTTLFMSGQCGARCTCRILRARPRGQCATRHHFLMAWSAARSVRHRLHMLQCAPPIAHSAHASACCTNWSSCLVWPCAGGATSPRGPSRATSSPTARCLGPGLVGFGRPLVPHAFGRATVLGNTVGVCVCAARFGAQADAAASGFEAIHSDRHCSQISKALNAWLVEPVWVSGRPTASHE